MYFDFYVKISFYKYVRIGIVSDIYTSIYNIILNIPLHIQPLLWLSADTINKMIENYRLFLV